MTTSTQGGFFSGGEGTTSTQGGGFFAGAGGGNYPNPVYPLSIYSPLGAPATPTVLQTMHGCDSKINNPGKVGPTLPRYSSPSVNSSKLTTNDFCSVVQPVCQMQDPNAPVHQSPGNSPTQVPPADYSGTGQIPYSPQAYCEATCTSLNQAYLLDFQNQCPSNTTAIKDHSSNHNNPNAPGPYIPLYFPNTGCVQNQMICSPNNVLGTNGQIVLPKNTNLLPASPPTPGNANTPAQLLCDRIPHYIYIPETPTNPNASCQPITTNNNTVPSCPPVIASSPNSQNDPTNPASILTSMGMGQVCSQSEQDSQSADSQHIQAQVSSSGGFFSGGMGASASTNDMFTEQASQHSQSSSGCAQRTAQLSNTTTNKNAQSCSISTSSDNATLTMNDSTTMNFTTTGPTQAEQNIIDNLIASCSNIDSNTYVGSKIQPWCTSINTDLGQATDDGINLTNTTLTNKSNISGSVQASANVSNTQNTAATFTDTVKQATTQNLQNLIGANALPLNTNQVIDQAMTDNQNIINTAITQIQNSSSLSSNGNNAVNMTSSFINMNGVNIDNQLISNLNSSALTKAATQIGQQIASQIVSDQSNTATDKTKVAGQEAIVNALAKANSTALNSGGNLFSSTSTIAIVIGVVVAVVAICGIFFYIKSLPKKPVGDTSSQSVGDTSSQSVGDTSSQSVGDTSSQSVGDTSSQSDSSLKSSSFKNKNRKNRSFSNMENPIKNTEIDYSFVCTITLSFCIFILFMFLIVKKK